MDVRIIKKSNVREITEGDFLMSKYFEEFFEKLNYSNWSRPQDITKQFKSADLISCKKEQSLIISSEYATFGL